MPSNTEPNDTLAIKPEWVVVKKTRRSGTEYTCTPKDGRAAFDFEVSNWCLRKATETEIAKMSDMSLSPVEKNILRPLVETAITEWDFFCHLYERLAIKLSDKETATLSRMFQKIFWGPDSTTDTSPTPLIMTESLLRDIAGDQAFAESDKMLVMYAKRLFAQMIFDDRPPEATILRLAKYLPTPSNEELASLHQQYLAAKTKDTCVPAVSRFAFPLFYLVNRDGVLYTIEKRPWPDTMPPHKLFHTYPSGFDYNNSPDSIGILAFTEHDDAMWIVHKYSSECEVTIERPIDEAKYFQIIEERMKVIEGYGKVSVAHLDEMHTHLKSQSMSTPEMLTIPQAAQFTGYDEKTIRNWIDAKNTDGTPMLPGIKGSKRKTRIPRISLECFRKQRAETKKTHPKRSQKKRGKQKI